MSKHTPGPWKWDEGFGAIVAGDGPDMLVTPMWRRGAAAWGEEINNANAALIAAAPELYAIVRAEYDAHGGFKTLPIGYPAERAAAICAAIAKAEGGAK